MKRYYLFGGEAVATFENEGAGELVYGWNNEGHTVDYQTVEFDEGKDELNWLLSQLRGWDNYLELTKKQYDEIIELERNLVP